MDTFPWPEGTLTRCIGDHGRPVLKKCETHIFEVGQATEVEDYTECGFIQAAKCLICNYVTPAIDADFWRIKADGMDFAGLSGEVQDQIIGLQEALDYIGKRMTGQPVAVMRDFG